jgi:hypothetical protein
MTKLMCFYLITRKSARAEKYFKEYHEHWWARQADECNGADKDEIGSRANIPYGPAGGTYGSAWGLSHDFQVAIELLLSDFSETTPHYRFWQGHQTSAQFTRKARHRYEEQCTLFAADPRTYCLIYEREQN